MDAIDISVTGDVHVIVTDQEQNENTSGYAMTLLVVNKLTAAMHVAQRRLKHEIDRSQRPAEKREGHTGGDAAGSET